jgi:SAM-dependent methyltransferase
MNQKMADTIYTSDAFTRLDERDDALFYSRDRFVDHLDAEALRTVERIIGELITEERPQVLDLMASCNSHLPDGIEPGKLTVLGLNRRELEANRRADERVVHDLNADPRLPFADDSFDVALNTVSVDYLVHPFEVFHEVERILRPGGLFLVIFSDRSFPQKVVKIWREASSEERLFMVSDFLLAAGFEPPRFFVSEGKPRPADDRYAALTSVSDPVYAAYAEKPGVDPERQQRPRPREQNAATVDRETVEARKKKVHRTLRCPYCDEKLTRYQIPQTPFTEWDSEYVYLCLNQVCPYLLEGWGTMREQGNLGFSYCLMYDPNHDYFRAIPVPSVAAMKRYLVAPRG